MKKTILKYKGITFPLFALSKEPYKIEYTLDKAYIFKTHNSHKELLDDKSLEGNYFDRLLQIDKRILFDFTCTSLQDLVYCKAKWGIDSNGIPHNFSKKYKAKVDTRKVERMRGNLIWLYNISYPFKVNTQEKLELEENLYAKIVHVNNEWYILDFCLDKPKLPFATISI